MILLTVFGKLVHDPEMKYSENGTEYLSLNLYTSEWDFKTKKRFTGKVRVTVFGKQAESLNNNIKKGCGVLASGDLEISPVSGGCPTYNKTDGSTVSSISIRGSTVTILTWPEKGEEVNVDGD